MAEDKMGIDCNQHNNIFREVKIMGADTPKMGRHLSIERRKYVRVNVPETESFAVTLEFNNIKVTGFRLMSISINGIAVAYPRPIAISIGSLIEETTITFPDGKKIISPAVVRHTSMEPDFGWNKYGLQFTDISRTQRDIINNFVLQNTSKQG